MVFDPKDLFDPVEGEPLRDLLGHLQNRKIRSEQEKTNKSLSEIAALLKEQKQENAINAGMAICPYCGGKIDGQFELCRHCRSQLSYIEGVPCKPGQEEQVKSQIEFEKQRLKFINQEIKVFTKGEHDYVHFNCFCGQSFKQYCDSIGSKFHCPACHSELEVPGRDEYTKFKKDKFKKKRFFIVTSLFGLLSLVTISWFFFKRSEKNISEKNFGKEELLETNATQAVPINRNPSENVIEIKIFPLKPNEFGSAEFPIQLKNLSKHDFKSMAFTVNFYERDNFATPVIEKSIDVVSDKLRKNYTIKVDFFEMPTLGRCNRIKLVLNEIEVEGIAQNLKDYFSLKLITLNK